MGIVGLDCKAYKNSATYASPTWAEMTPVKGVTTNLEKGAADLSKRGSTWKAHRSTLKDLTIELEMVWDHANTICTDLLTAFLNNTLVDCAFLDGPVATAGSQGPRCEFEVTKFSRAEPLEEGVMVNVTLKPSALATHDPTWFTAAGS